MVLKIMAYIKCVCQSFFWYTGRVVLVKKPELKVMYESEIQLLVEYAKIDKENVLSLGRKRDK